MIHFSSNNYTPIFTHFLGTTHFTLFFFLKKPKRWYKSFFFKRKLKDGITQTFEMFSGTLTCFTNIIKKIIF